MFRWCCQHNDGRAAVVAGSRTVHEDHADIPGAEETEEKILLHQLRSRSREEGPTKSISATDDVLLLHLPEAAPSELAGHGDGALEPWREMPRDEGAADTAGEHVAAGTAAGAASVQETGPEPALGHAQLQAVRVALRKRSVALVPTLGETEDERMMRFFIARSFSADQAAAMLAEDACWRLEKRVDALRDMSAKDVLGCDPEDIHSIMPVTIRGFDREGRPLVFKHVGRQCRPNKLLKFTTMAKLTDYLVWLNEQLTIALRDAGKQQWTVVIDAKGLQLGQLDSTGVRLGPAMAEIDSKHYPERLAAVVIINAPSVAAVVWNVIRRKVDEKTQKKVAIISNAAEAKQRLHELIAPDQLPAQFGGTAPALSPWPEHSGFD